MSSSGITVYNIIFTHDVKLLQKALWFQKKEYFVLRRFPAYKKELKVLVAAMRRVLYGWQRVKNFVLFLHTGDRVHSFVPMKYEFLDYFLTDIPNLT